MSKHLAQNATHRHAARNDKAQTMRVILFVLAILTAAITAASVADSDGWESRGAQVFTAVLFAGLTVGLVYLALEQ